MPFDLNSIPLGLASAPTDSLNKVSAGSMLAGQYASLWLLASQPSAGAVPAAVAVCDATTLGAHALPSRSVGFSRSLAWLWVNLANAGSNLIIEDRLSACGGLNATLITAQTCNVDISVATSNMVERVGATNYSECQFYLEWYTATGVTSTTFTCAVTYNDSTTGNIAVVIPASVAASRRYLIQPVNGKFIRSVQTVTLTASTGTAGSFGVTAVRPITAVTNDIANKNATYDFASLGCPYVYDNSCVTTSMYCITTTTGTVLARWKMMVLAN
jgi:hypothetical protein